jgi:hypothetical protein
MTATNKIQKGDEGADSKLKELFENNTPFKVPDGYFDELPERVLNACRKSDSINIHQLYKKPAFWRMTAAAAILIMAAITIIMVYTAKQSETESFTEYTLKDVYQYNFNNLADLEDAYLISLVGDDADEGLFLNDIDDNLLTDEDIIEYLLTENNIEYYTLNE